MAGFGVAKYEYLLTVPERLSEGYMPEAKEDLCTLFQCEHVEQTGPRQLKVLTALNPEEVQVAMWKFSRKHGETRFLAGSRVE